MNVFQTILESYGADYEDTMKRVMDSKERYIKFLGMLLADDNMDNLAKALDAGDLDAAFESAHTIKGVAGNMGLTPLYKAVADIVEPLRQRQKRDDYALMYQSVESEFKKVFILQEELKKAVEQDGADR